MVNFTRKKYTNKRRKLNKKLKLKKSKKRVLKRKQSKRLSRKNRRGGGDWMSEYSKIYDTIVFNYKFQTGENHTVKSGETLYVKMNNEEDFKPKIFDYIRISNHKEGTLSYTPSMIKFKDDLTEHRTRSIEFKYVSQFDFINSTVILMNVDEEKTKNPPSPEKKSFL